MDTMNSNINKKKRNIWTDETSPYGTYEGERGNPDQWKSFFEQAYDKTTAKEIIKEESPYTILGISKTATEQEIKKVFRKLMLIHHPDKGGDPEICKKIIAAYSILI